MGIRNTLANWLKPENKKSVSNSVANFFNKQRLYEAASPSRLDGDKVTMPVPMDYTVLNNQRLLRARSRYMFENTEMIKRYVQIMTTNVIGHTGIVVAPIVETPQGLLDMVVNQTMEEAFYDWSQAENCTILGNIDFIQLQKQIILHLIIDGEIFIRLHQGAEVNQYGFALETIDPELVSVYDNSSVAGGGSVTVSGIEYDLKTKQPTFYHISNLPPGSPSYTYQSGTGSYTRIPANQILHIYKAERVGQKRGIPWTATVINTVNQHKEFARSALIAARVGASMMAFLETTGGDTYRGTEQDQTTGQIYDEVEAGMIKQLPNGMTVKTFDAKYPNTMYADFERATLRQMASGLGVSYNLLTSDTTQSNYSSLKITTLDDRENFMEVQHIIVDRFMRPVYNNWLRTQLLMGSLQIPKTNGQPYTLKLIDEEKYQDVKFMPKKWAPLDENKSMNANIAAITQGLKTRSEVIRESGREPNQVWQEFANEQQQIKSLGLVFEATDPTVDPPHITIPE